MIGFLPGIFTFLGMLSGLLSRVSAFLMKYLAVFILILMIVLAVLFYLFLNWLWSVVYPFLHDMAVDAGGSLATIVYIIDFLNYVFALDELITVLGIYATIAVTVARYKFLKSWLPGLGSSGI